MVDYQSSPRALDDFLTHLEPFTATGARETRKGENVKIENDGERFLVPDSYHSLFQP